MPIWAATGISLVNRLAKSLGTSAALAAERNAVANNGRKNFIMLGIG